MATENINKITRGNSFPLLCTLKDNKDQIISANDIINLSVYLYKQVSDNIYNPSYYINVDGDIVVSITEKETPVCGVYRIIIEGEYEGERIYRNPIAFEIVNYIENEDIGNSCLDITPQINPIDINFIVGKIVELASEIPFENITGNPKDNIALKNELELIEISIPKDYITHNELNTSINNAIADISEKIPIDYVTEKELSDSMQSISDKVPTKVSQLLNDANYQTKDDLADYAITEHLPGIIWDCLGESSPEQINQSHLTEVLSNFQSNMPNKSLVLLSSGWLQSVGVMKYDIKDADVKADSQIIVNFPNLSQYGYIDSAGYKYNRITIEEGSFTLYMELRPGANLELTYKII